MSMVHIFFRILYHATAPIFGWLYESDVGKRLPPPTNDFITMSAIELARKIRKREVFRSTSLRIDAMFNAFN